MLIHLDLSLSFLRDRCGLPSEVRALPLPSTAVRPDPGHARGWETGVKGPM